MENNKGKLIIFEGIDGAGKSLYSNYVADYLNSCDIPAICIHAPTKSPSGMLFTEMLYNHSESCQEELALLAMAERCTNNAQILEYIEKGVNVLCDRYHISTLCYQHSVFLKYPELLEFSKKISLVPDCTFYCRITPEIAMERINKRNNLPGPFDKLEKLKYINSVYEYYLYGWNHSTESGYIYVINSDASVEKAKEEINKYVYQIFFDDFI